ncbi:hypothetical protein [Duganella qianjiadongensis]|uniref:Uncharacterized protein n=1 Tax=Duganella qianjiadongensis TaxID=2692176 RepID=A0ABW9VPK7_9BURK|nr:hypothetical protein [Duganella qianjiadongensis]MYM41420.1 hypothetical protein [Duganella qianjiadongensis]
MKRHLLLAVLANTKPISKAAFDQFLLKRHGAYGRENASSDTTLLDENEKIAGTIASELRRQWSR